MSKILALVDGSIYSESVCHHTAWIASRLNASVEIMHVIGRRETAASSDLSGALKLGARSALLDQLSKLDEERARLAQAQGHAILEDAKAILEQDGVGPVVSRLRKGDLLEAVKDFEQEMRVIVIGKRGEAADFATGHLGSNLERVVRSAKVPVFVASRAFQPINKVLAAYDGSKSTEAAIARMIKSPTFEELDITLVYAGEEQPAIQGKLDDAAQRLAAAGRQVTTRIVPGEPETALDKLVSEEGFDLLVMGTHGHRRIRSLIIGSTTTAMIQACKVPVLLYR
ncbi:universal stress protein [Paracoccus saliphilus]|uniref:Universal stress protein n=1 Tax=Paracoccus saliphilus TaxID=405559 RepID=A0AA46A5Q6_9RHOB|nr:universal stress protein [Paracoccus saliphilus]WCR04097.1 universal stress protein [Paracoccus saliphilus]SIS84915.1 Nucleotide-binding universal stress protein, UspA family [Paracoccus saliphilus]